MNEHDIRFVEDDWESPTLRCRRILDGKYGVMVWKITQFTYFQQMAGYGMQSNIC